MRIPLGGKRAQLLAARFAASALQLAMTLALTRLTDPAVAAACLVQFSWVQLASAAMAWGHPVTVLRDASVHFVDGTPYRLLPHMRWVLIVGAAVTVAGGVVFVLAFATDPGVVVLVGIAGLGQALTRVTSQALKAFKREAPAILLEFSFVPAVLLVATIAVASFGSEITPIGFAVTQAVASGAALAIILLLWRTAPTPAENGQRPEREAARAGSLHYLGVLQLLNIGTSQVPIVLAPTLLEPSAVAAFVVAFRVASIVTTVQNALNGYYGPSYARAFARRSRHDVARLLRSSQLVAAALCAPIIVIIPWASPILSLFGESYSQGAVAFAVLAVGQYVNAVTGLVSYVLSLSHREAALVIVNVVSLAILIAGWGAMAIFDSQSLTAYCAVFSAYLIAKNVVNYALARRVINSM